MHHIGSREFLLALGIGLLHSFFALFVILSSIWLCLAFWIQHPLEQSSAESLSFFGHCLHLAYFGVYVSGHI